MMSLNPQYETIGKDFIQQYYALFDDPAKRSNLGNFYSPTDALMTFEGHQLQGVTKIVEKVQSLSSKKITREITSVDCQPTSDGGVLISVLGRLSCGQDLPYAYTQVFVLKSIGGSFYVVHDIFRLNINKI